jgi:hypothetical protein
MGYRGSSVDVIDTNTAPKTSDEKPRPTRRVASAIKPTEVFDSRISISRRWHDLLPEHPRALGWGITRAVYRPTVYRIQAHLSTAFERIFDSHSMQL